MTSVISKFSEYEQPITLKRFGYTSQLIIQRNDGSDYF